MVKGFALKTDRLILREWRDEDLPLIAAINGDPVAMRHFVKPMTREESDAFIARHRQRQAGDGFCMWAVEAPGIAPIIGVLGLVRLDYEAHFTPNVEVGWRLGVPYWGKGYATEGAAASLRFGFEEMRLPEIVSTTVLANKPSWSVMERLGLHRDPADDFDHPRVPDGHRLKRHIVYRLKREEWERNAR